MLKFGQLLKQLIERNGNSISQLARDSGVERTSIHKAITGERVLSYKAAQKLAEQLCLSPHELKIFFEYHSMQLQGEDNFEHRRQIILLLNTLAALPSATLLHEKLPIPKTSQHSMLSDNQLYFGEFAIHSVIRQVIDSELSTDDPHIMMNLPASDSFILKYIYTVYSQYNTKLKVSHIIPFRISDSFSGVSNGIAILKDVLSLSLSAQAQYYPHFFYDKADSFSNPFPFYILTSTYLLCISSGYETVCSNTSPDILDYYKKHFLNALKRCKPLLRFQHDPFEILKAYSENTTSNSYYTFMPQPCLGRFYTQKLIADKLRPELPFYDELLQQSENRFSVLRAISGNYYTMFTKKGLINFMKDGVICDIPRTLITPMNFEERRTLIKNLRTAIADSSVIGRVIDDEQVHLPEFLSFCISANKEIDIFTLETAENKECFYNIHINEPLIGSAFLDFILYLPKSEYVLSAEKTLTFIDALLDEYASPPEV